MKKKSFFRTSGSIATSITLWFLMLISFIILFLSILSYKFTINDLENISITYTKSLISEITAGVDSYIYSIKNMASVICDNVDVQNAMSIYDSYQGKPMLESDDIKIKNLKNSIQEYLQTVSGTRNDITNVAIISKYQDVLLASPDKTINIHSNFSQTPWFLKPFFYKNQIIMSPSHVQNMIEGEYTWVISISKAITDKYTGNVIGVMVIDFNFSSIEHICKSAQLGKNGYAYIIDSDKNLIFHPQQLIYSGLKTDLTRDILYMQNDIIRTDKNKIYMKNISPLTKWTTVGVINANELLTDRVSIVNFYYALGGISLIIAAFAAFLIASGITKPIKELEFTMHLIERGNLSLQANTDIPNEIGHLGKSLNSMVSKIRELMNTAVANEEAKRKSEINALQAQINPHFLYNTLDTIIWMAASGRTDEVTEVTAALAKLFRTSISKDGNYVTLHNEIENIKSYLTIQKLRYGEKLNFNIDISPAFCAYMVPKLILQPIVENALYHGIKNSPDAGEIKITAYQNENILVICVTDNGIGMTPEQIENIFNSKTYKNNGIGIQNVNTRIKLCCGDRYGLHYKSTVNHGTCVELWFPSRKES